MKSSNRQVQKKTYKTMNIFLPIILGLGLLTVPFGILTFIFNYNSVTKNVNFAQVAPVLFLIILAGAIGVSIALTVKVKTFHITRLKRDSAFLKFASLLASIMVLVLFAYDFYKFLFTTDIISVLKIIRLVFAFPFAIHLFLSFLPRRINRRPVQVPKWLSLGCAISSILWSLIGLMALYFSSIPQNFFTITHTLFYVIVVLYFLFEIKFQFINQGSTRAHLITALLLFAFTMAVACSATIALMAGKISNVGISAFEFVCAWSLGLYALSRIFAVKSTLKHVLDSADTDMSSSKFRHSHGKKEESKHSSDNSSKENIEKANEREKSENEAIQADKKDDKTK